MSQKDVQQQKVRVCHISTVHVANDARIFYRQCCELVRTGYEVHLVINCEESGIKHGVHMHKCPRPKNRLTRILFTPWAALRLALKTNSTIYHYHDPELMFMGFVLRWVFRKKVVYDVHESVARHIMTKRWLPKCTRKIIALAYTAIEKILKHGQAIILANEYSVPDYDKSVYLVRNYPLLDESLLEQSKNTTKEPTVPMLIYVGGVWRSRGAMIYVELAGKLAEQGQDFRMMIIGPYDEKFGQELFARIRALNLEDKVAIPGRIDNKEAMVYVSKATLGLSLLFPDPNYTICLASKILEYMMFGVPVLASDFDHWRKYVEGEQTGVMVDPCDLDQIVGACEQMLSNRTELEAMGNRGKAAVRDKYNWSSEFAVLLKCYSDLLGR